nr:conserved hypothetical protein [Bosea sp. 7B]
MSLPILARCERPSAASPRALRVQPGRLAQGPDEKCGTRGRAAGIVFAIDVSILTDGRAALGRRVPSMGVGWEGAGSQGWDKS